MCERVRAALAGRGFRLQPLPDEGPESHARRLETALMALFRDTRTDEAFEALYRCARPALRAWIVQLLAGRAAPLDPSEVLQDTFVNVYRYASGFREGAGGGFRGWSRTIAANLIRRARSRGRTWSEQALPWDVREPADLRLGPRESAQSEEECAGLRRAWVLLLLHYAAAWNKLGARDQLALQLVELDGLSYDAAGRRLGVGRSNMKMIMFRSRKRIRALMLRAMATDDPAKLRLVGPRLAG